MLPHNLAKWSWETSKSKLGKIGKEQRELGISIFPREQNVHTCEARKKWI
jgi:hypothetical protein